MFNIIINNYSNAIVFFIQLLKCIYNKNRYHRKCAKLQDSSQVTFMKIITR